MMTRRQVIGAALALGIAPVLAENGHVVVDPISGLALGGVDPLTYFTDGEPRLGEPAHEAVVAGRVWRFVSAANRAAFLASPEAYMPRFGGYDAVRLSSGFLARGEPSLFTLYESRLFLFASRQNRSTFGENPTYFTVQAQEFWRFTRPK